jgi:hypothetical protein
MENKAAKTAWGPKIQVDFEQIEGKQVCRLNVLYHPACALTFVSVILSMAFNL